MQFSLCKSLKKALKVNTEIRQSESLKLERYLALWYVTFLNDLNIGQTSYRANKDQDPALCLQNIPVSCVLFKPWDVHLDPTKNVSLSSPKGGANPELVV